MKPGPLAGTRVVDLTRLLPGNYSTWLLSTLGADVIKVEDPHAGDYMRDFGVQVDGQGATHWIVNRGKRSVVLDLKTGSGKMLLRRLVDTADVVIESFRPGVMDRLGVGYKSLRESNPRLVYAAITGYGEHGPHTQAAGHDLNYIAISGLLERIGDASGRPVLPPIPLADLVGGGLVPTIGILALIMRARSTGEGGRFDTALTEGIALLPNLVVSDLLAGDQQPGRGRTVFAGGRAYYDVYECADGFVTVGAAEAHFFRELCARVGRLDLAAHQNDPDRQVEIRGALAEFFAPLTRAEIEEMFAWIDGCVMSVLSYEEMLASDQARLNGYVRECPGSPIPVLAPPFYIDGERPPETTTAPRQGENANEVWAELGLSGVEVAAARSEGAFGRF